MLRFVLILLLSLSAMAQTPLPRAHAHNDYEHARPLEDALSHGFGSVEADVYPINGELLVAHDLDKVEAGRTLEKLYLAPLKKRFQENRGQIIPGLTNLILLVDIKIKGDLACEILEKQLAAYKAMLTEFDGDKIHPNAVTIILSGDRPRDRLLRQSKRLLAMDGRLPDLELNPPRALIPLVSDSWAAHFKWRGGPLPDEEAAKLRTLVAQAHAQGRIIRFWAVPDNAEAWKLLLEAGVDMINTDKLAELASFLKSR